MVVLPLKRYQVDIPVKVFCASGAAIFNYTDKPNWRDFSLHSMKKFIGFTDSQCFETTDHIFVNHANQQCAFYSPLLQNKKFAANMTEKNGTKYYRTVQIIN